MQVFNRIRLFQKFGRIFVVAASVAFWAPFSDAAIFRTLSADAEGPRVVLVAPMPTHSGSIGVAKQVETLPLQKGQLTFVELERGETAEDLPALLESFSFTDADRPDWLWIHRSLLNDSIDKPVIRFSAEAGDEWAEVLKKRFEGKATVEKEGISESLQALSGNGIVMIEHPDRSRESRRVRHTRILVVELLRQVEMIAPDEVFEWERLKTGNENLVALYDAEGIGGAGPNNLGRIVSRIGDASLYRVCGEDIREGALAPAATVIFPGGSGGGIGRALEEKGRKIVRDYVMNGGGYLGVCAGAYFAASGLDVYLHAVDLQHSQPWRRGRDMVEIELTAEGQKFFGTDQTVLTTRYANGPVFLAEDQEGEGDPEFQVLATFKTPSTDRNGIVREEMVGQAAIGARAFGDGRLLIISPHPESHEEHDDLVGRGISWTMGPGSSESGARMN